jgi:hypothetical protein
MARETARREMAMRLRVFIGLASLSLAGTTATGQSLPAQGFDNVATLPGAGWVLVNRSQPLGSTSWFQGSPALFPSQSGSPSSYIAANYQSASGAGTQSVWLLSPPMTLMNGGVLSFYTRCRGSGFPDRLQVRFSTNGTSTDVGTTATSTGDFTHLVAEINVAQAPGGYPEAWTLVSVAITGAGTGPVQGRLALRYFVTDGGPLGTSGDYIGVDTLAYTPYLRGDFGQDANTDLLWRHATSGENVVWHMLGAVLNGGVQVNPALADTSWKMVGTHDFNADNKTDVLWRHDISGENVVWYMNGTNLATGTFLTPSSLSDVGWKMAGTGDFNQDGKPDIVWHHQGSGQVVLWYMNGSVMVSGTFTSPDAVPDTNWKVLGVADFNSDGRPDLLWQNLASGELIVWYMNNQTLINPTNTMPQFLTDLNWRLVAVGDYDSDTKPDLVWRHATFGENVLWFMDGVTLISGTFTTTLADTNWKIVGPR